MTEQIERVIAKGKPLAVIRKLVETEYKRLDRVAFDKAMRDEYDALFPTYYPTEQEVVFTDGMDTWREAKEADGFEITVFDTERQYAEYRKQVDYSEDETYKTFEEYMNETRVIQEAVYEDEFVDDINVGRKLVSPEITEFVRPYVANDITDKVDAYMLTLETANSKEEAQTYLNSTDWYVARYGETGVAIPDDIKAKRAEARLIL